MPDVWTHILCGREVLGRVEEGCGKTARERIKLFNLGCQGPDLFFYYDFLPWSGDRRVFDLGNQVHHQRCGLFFRESLHYARANPGAVIIVYLMGMICHWCLDRATHPYINYISGVYRGAAADSRKLINNHKRVEAAIDVLLGKRLLNLEVRKTPAHPEIEVGEKLPRDVLGLYRHVLPLVFPEAWADLAGTHFLNKSYRDMLSALRLLHDPRGVKRSLVAAYDRLSGGGLNLRYYFYRPPEKNGEAYLNDQKRPWCHPADPGEVRHESFMELFAVAVEEAARLINLSLGFIRGEAGEAEINQKIKDISYSTGRPVSDQSPLRCFDPLLED